MELIIYLSVVALISVASFWIAGSFYGLIHRPAIYFPISLAAKMTFCAVFGSFIFMIGGVVLSTLVLNHEMAKRRDYSKWPTIFAGVIISIVCIIFIYFSGLLLAWQILG